MATLLKTLLLASLATAFAAACSDANLAGAGKSEKSKDTDKEEDEGEAEPVDEDQDVDQAETEEEKEDQVKKGTLVVAPETARLFKGETADLEATYDTDDASPKEVTTKARWTSAAKDVVTVAKGKVTAVGAGEAKVQASYAGAKDSATVTVVKCREVNAGAKATDVRVKGENWPGNGIDPGGADFDDYFVVIHGDFNVDGFQLSSNVDQDFTVTFSIGSAGSTSQTVQLQAVDCDGKSTQSADVSGTTGTQNLHAAKGDRFNLVTTARTGSQTRVYELLKDKESAFKIVVE